jgi:hypothetical protein
LAYALGKLWERRTECLVVLPHKGERVEVDVTVEVHLRPARRLDWLSMQEQTRTRRAKSTDNFVAKGGDSRT